MLDSPEGVCAGQARFEYPATFVLFSNILAEHTNRSSGSLNVHLCIITGRNQNGAIPILHSRSSGGSDA